MLFTRYAVNHCLLLWGTLYTLTVMISMNNNLLTVVHFLFISYVTEPIICIKTESTINIVFSNNTQDTRYKIYLTEISKHNKLSILDQLKNSITSNQHKRQKKHDKINTQV